MRRRIIGTASSTIPAPTRKLTTNTSTPKRRKRESTGRRPRAVHEGHLQLETMSNTTAMQGMLYRTLGDTGENVSAIGIGGWHIGLNGVDEQLSIRIVRTA